MHGSLQDTMFNERRKCMFKRPLKSMFKNSGAALLRGQIVRGRKRSMSEKAQTAKESMT